jgi:dihydroorotate dehydrogenase electron transfer subunit
MTENTIKTVKIERIINDCKGVKSILFNMRESDPANYVEPKPGQFAMVWVPGVDEVPMSISGCTGEGQWVITVKNVGECTNALHALQIGDFIGVRGPLGNFFQIPQDMSKTIFLIGGGIGFAPLRFLALILNKNGFSYNIIIGAKNQDEIIHFDDFTHIELEHSEIMYCTDDGSYGEERLASETFDNILNTYSRIEASDILVYTCGPEKMMYAIFKTCEKYKIELQASLERIMRCGCGLCGLCALDPIGMLVCKDGPIFNSETLRQISDFGSYKRDFSGRKTAIK